MKRINWEIFFGDSSSEEALCLFASGYYSFTQFSDACSLSEERKKIIKLLKHRGYKKSMSGAQRALRSRGFDSYRSEYENWGRW